MLNSTSNTYQLKRNILNFSNKISRKFPRPEQKFAADMTYGMPASQSCLLTDTAHHLHESFKKINIADRLSRHLAKGTPTKALNVYLFQVQT